jgi:superfamily II DNA/RNA helicase
MNIPSSIQRRITDKIESNKLTILVGPTGCGKSTQVPQILLDKFGPCILCTQPRRLAVAAVATYVAKQKNVVLGEKVGYHIGQERIADLNGHKTELLFATAGILLEELRSHGLDALTKYRVVIIDECHERSTESDLCLTIIKEFMISYPRSKIRLVLMSATFNHSLYTSFFKGVPGCEYVDTITLETAQSMNVFYNNIETLYLEDIKRMIKYSKPHVPEDYYIGYFKAMKEDPRKELSGSDGRNSLSQELLNLIMLMVFILDDIEDPDRIFLIFAPTYRHLEQLYNTFVDPNDGFSKRLITQMFDIRVLHSSIDIEYCLESIPGFSTTAKMDSKSTAKSAGERGTRKVFLASAIADSSLTIPGVSCVIDTCRALEVRWNSERSTYDPIPVWASQEICDQRRGRTGRTCAGKVFRLVHGHFYNNNFVKWEKPKLTLASCRDELLLLASSRNKVMSDPQEILEKCMDAPHSETVTKAIAYLKDIGACEEKSTTSRGKKSVIVPTEYGRLISTLPFTVEEASIVVYGAKNGLLHEALALIAVKNVRPQPIVHEFGENKYNENNLRKFFQNVDIKNPMSVAIAHLAAYIYWRVNWTEIRRQAIMSEFLNQTAGSRSGHDPHPFFASSSSSEVDILSPDCNLLVWTPEIEDAHTKWCKQHFINPTSVKMIQQHVDSTMKTIYHSDFEPDWLRCQKAEPEWNRNMHLDIEEMFGRFDVFSSVYGSYKGTDIAERILIELQEQSLLQRRDRHHEVMACIHFLRGHCIFGEDCKNSHSQSAPRPLCRFFSRPGGCTNVRCLYSHEERESDLTNHSMIDTIFGKYEGGSVNWYRKHSRSMLIVGEGNFTFCHALGSLNAQPAIASTKASILPSTLNGLSHYIAGLDATRCHVNQTLLNHPLSSNLKKFAWNFPSIDEIDDSDVDEANKALVQGFFLSVATYIKLMSNKNCSPHTKDFEVGLALQANQFSHWSVLQSAHSAGFFLEWWDDFFPSAFPGYSPCHTNQMIQLRRARFYVLRMRSAT